MDPLQQGRPEDHHKGVQGVHHKEGLRSDLHPGHRVPLMVHRHHSKSTDHHPVRRATVSLHQCLALQPMATVVHLNSPCLHHKQALEALQVVDKYAQGCPLLSSRDLLKGSRTCLLHNRRSNSPASKVQGCRRRWDHHPSSSTSSRWADPLPCSSSSNMAWGDTLDSRWVDRLPCSSPLHNSSKAREVIRDSRWVGHRRIKGWVVTLASSFPLCLSRTE